MEIHVAKSVACASSQADGNEMEWFNESFQHGMTFDALADSGEDRYAPLDMRRGQGFAQFQASVEYDYLQHDG